MNNFPNMRLYENVDHGSITPVPESRNSGWKLPKDFGGGFSAMCWYFGRDLYTALAKAGDETPVGLVETNVGGTPGPWLKRWLLVVPLAPGAPPCACLTTYVCLRALEHTHLCVSFLFFSNFRVFLVPSNDVLELDQHWSSPDALSACKNLPGNPAWEWPVEIKLLGFTENLLENTLPGWCFLGTAACYLPIYADERSPDDVIAF